MYPTLTGLLFTAKPFYNVSTSAYSTSFSDAMCLVGHTCNCGYIPLWSMGDYNISS